eukprot:gene1874-4970_t
MTLLSPKLLSIRRAAVIAVRGLRCASQYPRGYPRFEGITAIDQNIDQDHDEVHLVPADVLSARMTSNPYYHAADVESEKVFREYDNGKRIFHFVVDTPKDAGFSQSKKDGLFLDAYRNTACSAIRQLRALKATSLSLHVECEPDLASGTGKAVLQSALLAGYTFDNGICFDPLLKQSISLKVNGKPFTDAETAELCKATILARDLVNERADIANPKMLHDVAEEIAANTGMTFKSIVGIPALDHEDLHLISAVGQGSRFEPRLVCLEHMKGKPDQQPIVLVGKGITFDTGGLNLKPTKFIENMHFDMGGSAAVLGAMQAIAKLNIPVNVVGVVALAENAVGSGAYKPMAVIKSRSGKTVEVGNTDAEGRLVLADALTYAQETYEPHTVIDVATLTGACIVALGPYAAGIFTNDSQLSDRLISAGQTVYERLWPLPILPEHREEMKGTIADINSTGPSRYGGASTAAAFLEMFIKDSVHWAHLDIAGPSDYAKAAGPFPQGGTGFGVQVLARYVASCAA